jgi:DNA modification methylase
MSETIFGEELASNECETEIKMGKAKVNIYLGDCLDVLRRIERNTVDLIITSPPYADSREKTYGGIKPDQYVNWFLPRSAEFLRVLKPTGTFILNIKERVANGERHTYVLDLILKLREQGWLWTEEFVWHKKNCHPGKWPNRFRDAWERLLQFNKSRHFAMYQDVVMVPMGEWAKTRLKHLGKNDVVRFNSQVKSGFGKNISNWIGRQMAYPSNVLHMATETGNEQHSAVFPRALPEWFIKLFTKENDLVLDPFLGSGTVIEVAYQMKRNSIGIESVKEYYHLAKKRLAAAMKERTPSGRKVEREAIKRNGEKELAELTSSV